MTLATVVKLLASSPDGTLWPHVAGLLAIAIGLADLWVFRAFPGGLAVNFLVAGFTALGLGVAFNAGNALR